jgi:hypothetical protein
MALFDVSQPVASIADSSSASTLSKQQSLSQKPRTLTSNDDIELETTLQELVLNLLGDRVETDVGLSTDFFSHFGLNCIRRRCQRCSTS